MTTEAELKSRSIQSNALDDPTDVAPLWDEDDPLQDVQRIQFPFCEVRVGSDLFLPLPFRASHRLKKTNEQAIRFGGSNDMITLLEGSSDEQADYLFGLVAGSVLVAIFFALWTVLILVFKFNGYRRCGFLCGRFIRPNKKDYKKQLLPAALEASNESKSPEQPRDQSGTSPVSTRRMGSGNLIDDGSDAVVVKGMDGTTDNLEQEGGSDRPNVTATIEQESEAREHAPGVQSEKPESPEGETFTNVNDNRFEADKVDDAETNAKTQDTENEESGSRGIEDGGDGNAIETGKDAFSAGTNLVPVTSDTPMEKQSDSLGVDEEVDDAILVAMQYQADHEAWLEACQRQEKRVFRVRIVLVISCIFICVAGILFCYYGEKYVSQTFVSAETGFRHIQDLCQVGIVYIDGYIARQEQTRQGLKDIFSDVNGLCPNVRQRLCEVVEPVVSECNFSDLPFVSKSLEVLFSFLYTSEDYINQELLNLRDDLQDMYNDIEDPLNSSVSLEWAFWVAFAFMIALIVCCCVIVLGIYWNHRYGHFNKAQRFFGHRVVFPIFCVLACVDFAFSLAVIITSVGASDWCINSPDAKVSYVLDEVFKDTSGRNSVIYSYAKYYVNSCQSTLAPVQPEDQSTSMRTILQSVADFAQDVGSVQVDEWIQACGQDLNVLQSFQKLVEELLCELTVTLEDINRFFWCRHWSPIYTNFMHEAICFDVSACPDFRERVFFDFSHYLYPPCVLFFCANSITGSKWIGLGGKYQFYDCGFVLCGPAVASGCL